MKRRIKIIAALLACTAVLVGGALAAGLGTGDSLISLSWLEQAFIPDAVKQGVQRLQDTLNGVWQAADETLDRLADEYLHKVGAGQSGGYSSAYGRKTFSVLDVITLQSGSGVIVEAGSVMLDSGTVVDVTEGKEQAAGTYLTAGHRYIVAEESEGVFTVESDAARVAVEGVFSVELSGMSASPFTDIKITDWYRDAVNEVYARGLFAGTGDGSIFAPEIKLDRAMMMTVLFHLAGDPDEERFSAVTTFPDVKEGEWYETYVRWAAEQGISAGYGDGNFRPLQTMTRREVVQFLYNFAISYLGLDVSERVSLDSFEGADILQADGWGEEAMSWAVAMGIISELRPNDYPVRGEVAAIMAGFAQIYFPEDAPN